MDRIFHRRHFIERINFTHCDLKISMAQAKLDKNFANYFLIKKQVKNKFFLVLKCTCKRATEKHK